MVWVGPRWSQTTQNKVTAYFYLIHSYTEYCTTVWDSYQKYNSDKVERVQCVELQGLLKVDIQDRLNS